MRIQWIVNGVFGSEQTGYTSDLASNRYRVIAPYEALRAAGHDIQMLRADNWDAAKQTIGLADVVAIGKLAPGGDQARIAKVSERILNQIRLCQSAGIKVVADFNDDHFQRPGTGLYWSALAQLVDLCVVGSPAMETLVRQYSSRPIHVISDPLLGQRQAPRVFSPKGRISATLRRLSGGPRDQDALQLLWFGNLNNFDPLVPWLQALSALAQVQPWRLTLVTSPHDHIDAFVADFNRREGPGARIDFVEWSEAAQAKALARAHVALLPSAPELRVKSVKTSNRLTDSLQAGCYVIASRLPSYETFEPWCALGDDPASAVRDYLSDPQRAADRVSVAQEFASKVAGIEVISQRWLAAFEAAADDTQASTILKRTDSLMTLRRVFILAPAISATIQIRFLYPLQELMSAGRLIVGVMTEMNLLEKFGKLANEDDSKEWLFETVASFRPEALIFCRYAGPHVEAIRQWAKEHNVPVLLHLDDDLLAVPESFGAEKHAFHHQPQRMKALQYLLETAEVVHCSTKVLADRLKSQRAISGRVCVASVSGVGRVVRAPKNRPARKIGYMGTRDHRVDLALIAQMLAKVLTEYPSLVFEVFGTVELPEELEVFGDRINLIPGAGSYGKFLAAFAEMDWDIGLCPLVATDFNAAKSDIKWVDYTGIGAAVVASKGLVYDDCCASGRGVLVGSADEWYEAISQLLNDPQARCDMVQRAQQLMLDRYRNDVVVQDIFDAIEAARVQLKASGVQQSESSANVDLGPVRAGRVGSPIKLNLGCGDKILPGFVNVDVVASRAGKKPDVMCDLHELTPFADNSVDEVMAIHVVEHFWRWEVEDVLREWMRVLKPGGRMVLECPNLRTACEAFLADAERGASGDARGQRTMWVFYGDPQWQDPLMVHRWGYTPQSLAALMTDVGLVDVRQEPAQYKLREPRDMRVLGFKP